MKPFTRNIGNITFLSLSNLKPEENDYRIKIDTGFVLLVKAFTKNNPQGSKLWQHRYRINKKRRIISYGKFPAVSLLDAKEKYLESCKLIAQGIDPLELKKEQKLEKEKKENAKRKKHSIKYKYTFKNMAEEWHSIKSPRWSIKHRKEVLSSLNRFIFPRLGNTPIADIKRIDLMEIYKGIENRTNAPLTALRKLRQRVESIFWYVMDTYDGVIEHNVAASIKAEKSFKALPDVQHMRALPKEDIPKLMTAIEQYNGFMTTKLALKMLIYTAVRHSELRFSTWKEINWNDKQWVIPKTRMKRKKSLVIPLSKQVIEILKELQTINGDFKYIFASYHKPDKQPISENGIISMLKRINFWKKSTAHGMRSLFSSICNHEQINPDWIEMQLAHVSGDKTRSAYNRNLYLAQRTIMMQWYANYIDGERIDFEDYFKSYNKKEKSKLMQLAK